MANFEYWLACTFTGNLALGTLLTGILATLLIAIV